MRLLYLCDRYWPAIGGIETTVRNLARQLVASGHQVRVLTISDAQRDIDVGSYSYRAPAPKAYRDGDVLVRVLGATALQRCLTMPIALRHTPLLRRSFGTLNLLSLPFFKAAHQPGLDRAAAESDLVHCFGGQYLGATGLPAARRAGIPFVITPFCHPGHWGDDAMNVRTYRGADLVLGLSSFDSATYLGMGVPPARVGLMPIPLGPQPAAAPRREREPYVLFLGRVNAYKGIDRLFKAWPLVRAGARALLLVAGPAEGQVRPPAGARYLGPVDEPAKAALLAGARALVLPSRGEIMPNVLLEAWARAVPVVVSDIPALAAFVRDGTDGIVTDDSPRPLAAAILRLLGDAALGRRLGAAGRLRVEREHGIEQVAAGLMENYRRLTAARARVAAE